MIDSLQAIFLHFNIPSSPVNIKRYGEGHIHETYRVETGGAGPDYILQKINHQIFRDIPGMMKNIEAVSRHLLMKLRQTRKLDAGLETLQLISTKDGDAFYHDDEGNYWRMYIFIPGSVTHQQVKNNEMASEAGRAIGVFQSLLSDFQTPLIETIPDFHDINLRISQYLEAKKNDPAGRADEVAREMRFTENQFEKMREFFGMLKNNALIRVTHNDTKLNNILFDKSGNALCLVDLDTVMPGYIHFDYGDALRTMACNTAEDEPDLTKVYFRNDVYEYFTSAYLEQTRHFLNPEEIKLLPYAPVYMTFIIGLRFLTDYINGDVYYRIQYPDHNLVRARVQFKLIGYPT